DAHPRRLEDLDRGDGAKGAAQGREARRYRHAHPPGAGEERQPGDRAHREALDRGRRRDPDPAGRAVVRLLFLLLISTSLAAQEAKPKSPPKKPVAQKAHAKATPEQLRRFKQMEEKRKK